MGNVGNNGRSGTHIGTVVFSGKVVSFCGGVSSGGLPLGPGGELFATIEKVNVVGAYTLFVVLEI